MASFRILNQAPQYLLLDGTVNAGGKLFFFETDLTTPKDTWSDEAMTTLNSNPVVMDSAGRTLTDVWGDGEYGVVMTDADEVTIWTRNNVKADAGAGTSIPAVLIGVFLSIVGALLLWQEIVLLPDLTGTSGNILWSDGAIPFWAPPPEIPEPPAPLIAVTATTVSLDDGGTAPNKMLIQSGTATAPASGNEVSSVAVVFGTPFGTAPTFVGLQVNGITTASGVALVAHSTTSISTTGFTANFNIADRHFVAGSAIINAIPFNYLAMGIIP